jgi:hypothetical protein
MRKDNFVSLWLGRTKSSKTLDKYLKVKYSDDGDFVPSVFAKKFQIERYEEGFREAEFYEQGSNNIYELLEGFSYDNVLIEYFKNILGENVDATYNTVILLYNFEYNGSINEYRSRTEYFKFIGSTRYR